MTGAAANAGITAGPTDSAGEGVPTFAAAYASRLGVARPAGMPRLRRLLDLLGHPQRAFPSIVVAGSVGKSSTVAAITALLDGFGIRAGSLRSPDWLGAAARVGLAGAQIPADVLDRAYDDIAPYLPLIEDDGRLCAFELLAAVTFAAFADAPVDLAVVESGWDGATELGDLADLLDGPVAAITPLAVSEADADEAGVLADGTEPMRRAAAGDGGSLGADGDVRPGGGSPADGDARGGGDGEAAALERIAAPVGGAIRADVLVVLAQQSLPAARALLRRAAAVGATVAREGLEFGVVGRRVAVGGQMITLKGLGGTYEELFLPLHGAHQAHNAAVALATVEAFLGGGRNQLDIDALRSGLAQVDGRGRLEVVRRSPSIVLDVAGDPVAAAALASALDEAFTFEVLVGVLAVEGDEALAAHLLAALEPVLSTVVVTTGVTPAALPVDDLAAVAAGVFGADRVEVAVRLDDAIDDAVRLAEEDGDLGGAGVLVTGSAPVVGRARVLLRS
ncbi:Folylpolyglutamate synthase [Frankia canadensis]|uniref:tetrahydrofolate synthase n=1 Tax=Frankia canadensis TaxID=1836972 RepID=A0A2I2KVG3_9ACTN|nr:cyanophycin synthetase [Frankia canadensis]SNQ49650.1 Folylpolyglutamate synthase [Frankia canadensis]SOU56940.1 Folylpolyglutamate synthase [Frankia canadensis]